MIHDSIYKLNHYLEVVPTRFKSISSDKLADKPRPDKWSKNEILGHLIDSALHNLQRFTTILFTPQPFVLTPYQQNEWVSTSRYQEQSAAALTTLWHSLNLQIINSWKNYTSDDLNLIVKLSQQSAPESLQWWVEDYTTHLEHHLQQIFGTLESMAQTPSWHIGVAAADQALQNQPDQRFVTLLEHGSMQVEYYAPKAQDLQQPHRQDELYIVQSGQSVFYNNGKRKPCTAGDVLFVPAGMEHRFEDFSDDFATWVVFYGPDGGELPQSPYFEKSFQINHEAYQISTDSQRLDRTVIHQFLTHSYWGKGRPLSFINRTISKSLNFGLYHDDQQIGFARVVTDYSLFAYLADVFVLDPFRGKGLGKKLVETILEAPDFHPKTNWILGTSTAYGLYEQLGFSLTKRGHILMEKRVTDE